ncbi:MAG: hypothetical protein CVU64_19155 [Deltaproteobacteria bacterium HGW-Deltaproteobacteria-21]|nr:MAG: hypothetical protein CVU64_19155 [Deltaproteobacteria bacterium HGW-Deltaproteobacteria-21]
MTISIIIPCYNESGRIAGSLQKLGRFCEEQFKEYEIIVVDDGSKDGTWETVRGLRGLPIRSIRFAGNRGKGAAVKAGMLEAKGTYRFFTDADLPYHLSAFSSAMGMFESAGCDLVLGSRYLPGSEDRAGTNVVRKLASRIFSSLAGRIFGIDIRDSQCGFKGFRDRAAEALFSRCTTSGFAFDVEIFSLAKNLDLKICRTPVILVDNNQSSIRLPRDGLAMLWQLMKIRIAHKAKDDYSPQRRRERRVNSFFV